MSQTDSQANKILEYMKQGNTITPLEALNIFGCMRLGARIWDLKDQGYNIITETEENEGKRYAKYKLITKAKQQITEAKQQITEAKQQSLFI